MNRFRPLLVAAALLAAGCTSSSDEAASAVDEATDTTSAVAAEASQDTPAPATEDAPPTLAAVLEAGGAEADVAACQADVLAAAGIAEVRDLEQMAEAMSELSDDERAALTDCVN